MIDCRAIQNLPWPERYFSLYACNHLLICPKPLADQGSSIIKLSGTRAPDPASAAWTSTAPPGKFFQVYIITFQWLWLPFFHQFPKHRSNWNHSKLCEFSVLKVQEFTCRRWKGRDLITCWLFLGNQLNLETGWWPGSWCDFRDLPCAPSSWAAMCLQSCHYHSFQDKTLNTPSKAKPVMWWPHVWTNNGSHMWWWSHKIISSSNAIAF